MGLVLNGDEASERRDEKLGIQKGSGSAWNGEHIDEKISSEGGPP